MPKIVTEEERKELREAMYHHTGQLIKERKTIQLTRMIPPTGYFVISSVLIYLGLYEGIPAILAAGIPFIKGYPVLFYLPFIFMFITALVLYRKEGNPWQLSAFKQILNLTRLKRSDWFWILGIILVYLILAATTAPIMNNLAQHSFFSPPSFFPAEINPNKAAPMEQTV